MSELAYVFPGQGSQSVGMLAEFAAQFPIVEQTFAEASSVLGYDLWQLVQSDAEGKLNQTQITQPALLAASVAVWRVLEQSGAQKPAVLAGHSLGEYSALVCAGVLSFEDGIKLVEARGQFMQSAVPAGSGAMYAIIGLDDNVVGDVCARISNDTGEVVAPVNYNSPGQVVIAGQKEAVEAAGVACKDAGAKRALPLSVSVPSHCALMKPAAEQLAALLDKTTFNQPVIPVINNVDVAKPDEPAAIKDALVRQLYSPVRWTETVQALVASGVTECWEVGPGKVLTGLAKRIDKGVAAKAINTPADLV
ncbi:ACP S-malonyltransferase [Aestuariibacter halophilus]|uniref:Malonyl CoA-acyl carrier protein transacylase n=1 Tax=Fluctibacter halophilus TaxID=226011 RepID=A0ABS8G8V1_9ALTE|nr:ACP S-malonyltransferase [Aestuariibacter halophilus]MCC2615631.1 ACP S-malonyltransferase [Aestuariibacter halophilus]